MEKYSAYRDPGTGIHPFLLPVPPQESGSVVTLLKPILFLVGAARTTLVLVLVPLYVILVQGVCKLFSPIPPLRRAITSVLISLLCRLSLLLVGVYWIPVEVVRRKRGRFATKEAWSPKAGDLIVSNWISWVEIAWLAFKFNPMFVLPITEPVEKATSPTSSPSRVTPGRRTGTGSAAVTIPSQNRIQVKRAEVRGFTEVSLLHMLFCCGRVPPYGMRNHTTLVSLDEIRSHAKSAGQPFVLFPECTTSNGRGLLRFSYVLKGIPVPVNIFNVFVMCVRIDPPTALSPTLSLPIPSSRSIFNPIPHVFSICSSVMPHTISIRLLAPGDSPSSDSFMLNEVLSGPVKEEDMLGEICSILISEIGRVKRTGMGWEEKAMFLDFYRRQSW